MAADVIIAGLGTMGSAAAYHLARRGRKILGFDQFSPPHDRGSSHGETRIIREAYFEHPSYVPLVQRAYQLWEQLSQECGEQLLLPTGGLMIGPPQSALVTGARQSVLTHKLPHEELSAAEVRRRFPALQPTPDMAALWEPRAGILFPEKCVRAHLTLAAHHGATLRLSERIQSWSLDGGGVWVQTTQGRYRANQLLVTAGAWLHDLLPDLPLPLRLERPATFWYEPSQPLLFHPGRCPIHMWEHAPQRFFYGFPDLGNGVKVAEHHGIPIADPNTVDRTVSAEDTSRVQSLVRKHLPGLRGPPIRSSTCLYTNTPDGHFHIDRVPGAPQVWAASPCSGHGFKFSSVIGEVLAQLILEERLNLDISLFRHRAIPPVTCPS